MEERSTIKAAEKLYVTQPSISRSLANLRTHFDDELFINTRQGLKPTALSIQLGHIIPSALDNLQNDLKQIRHFDPSSYEGVIRIAINSFLSMTLPALFQLHLLKVAPGIRLEIHNWDSGTLNKLISSEYDLAINYSINDAPKDIISKELATDSLQFLVRDSHPLLQEEVTQLSFSQYPLATIIAKDWNDKVPLVNLTLKSEGIETKDLFRSENFSDLVYLTKNTDAILPTSSVLSNSIHPGLVRLNYTLPVIGSKPISFITNKANSNDQLIDFIFKELKKTISKQG